jgi:hypothetical protein
VRGTTNKLNAALLCNSPVSLAATGTLQQAVLTECICSEVLAIPLLFMTRAHATCDWALVLSLSIFGVCADHSGRRTAVLRRPGSAAVHRQP